ncbi:MAG: sulfurtransferase TusA family protein [Acidimicrobiia bacterium]
MTTKFTPAVDDERVDVELDARGLLCPLPVYRASLALTQLSPGQVLRLFTTDPGSLEDIPALARQTGDILLAAERREDDQVFWIEKASRS